MKKIDPAGTQFIIWGSDWTGHPTSSIHLARGLVRQGYDVFWVNSIGMRSPRLSAGDLKRAAKKIANALFKKKVHVKQTGICPAGQLHPFIIPFYSRFRKINKILIKKQLAALKLTAGQVILVTTLPNTIDFIDYKDPVLKIYYIMDDFSSFPGVNHNEMVMFENALLKKVDGVIFASGHLLEKYRSSTENPLPCSLLTHGADLEHFGLALRPQPLPADLQGRKKFIGFFGLIDGRIDLKLIRQIAENFPGHTLVLIGGNTVDILLDAPNILMLGPKPYEELPLYLHHFDVCILPYVKGPETEGINPLKLKECLAAGRQVVATDIPTIRPFANIVRIAKNNDDFIARIKEALADPAAPNEIAASLGSRESWLAKSGDLLSFCESIIGEKG